jgi:hypothetical protein
MFGVNNQPSWTLVGLSVAGMVLTGVFSYRILSKLDSRKA